MIETYDSRYVAVHQLMTLKKHQHVGARSWFHLDLKISSTLSVLAAFLKL